MIIFLAMILQMHQATVWNIENSLLVIPNLAAELLKNTDTRAPSTE